MFAEIDKTYAHSGTTLPMVVQSVGYTYFQPPMNRPKGHYCHHCLLVLEGTIHLEIDHSTILLNAGEGFYCRPEIAHKYHAKGSILKTAWLTFYGANSVLDYYKIGNWFSFRFERSLYTALLSLLELCKKESNIILRGTQGLVWVTNWLESVFSPSPHKAIQLYLHAHFQEPVTLDQLASYVHMSRFSLCHHYKQSQGITVMEELKRIRMNKAKQFLYESYAPIQEIAKMCGYDSPSYFCKLFRQYHGMTPNQCRKNAGQEIRIISSCNPESV